MISSFVQCLKIDILFDETIGIGVGFKKSILNGKGNHSFPVYLLNEIVQLSVDASDPISNSKSFAWLEFRLLKSLSSFLIVCAFK
mmetsp:Transcript_9975/g.9897  ORF Transcript_9975/g.9897 Transcript_9975/m.9897 type:complete len:85 (+) Transcript_9975:731-985(+)